MPIVAKQRVRFGPFELDTRARELYRHGLRLKLGIPTPYPFRIRGH